MLFSRKKEKEVVSTAKIPDDNVLLFSGAQEVRSEERIIAADADFIRQLANDGFTKDTAMAVPAIASAVNLIASTIAGINFKMYKREKGDNQRAEEVDDYRERLVNSDTGDLLNGYEMKKAFVRDYLLSGNGYIYKEEKLGSVKGLYYVDEISVSVITNNEPIFKKAMLYVQGKKYYPDDFVIITRNSTDGVTGKGLLDENKLVIGLIRNILKMLNNGASGGGAKRGFLKSTKRLAKEQISDIKEAYNKLYSNAANSVIVLNEGLDFVPATETTVEMQTKEIYRSISNDVGEALLVPECVLNGTATNDSFRNWFRSCIIPILNEICAALNDSLLKEAEKESYFWKADTTEIENGDLKAMFEAYDIAYRDNIMQIDEIREKIGLGPLGFNYIKLGLDTVLYDPEKQIVYTPNTNKVQEMNETGGGNNEVAEEEKSEVKKNAENNSELQIDETI